MTQEIVAKHFLRAGSSRYQDEEFVKSHPDFSAISRFGIGVLSAFMVSDEVEVATIAAGSDEKARTLRLRSLHGRYLIREFDRDSPEVPKFIKPHGTRISLTLRAGASIPDVLKTTRHWVVFPPCPVYIHIGTGAPVRVGYHSPEDAIKAVVGNLGLIQQSSSGEELVKVAEFERGGVTLAVALRYSEYFREWELLQVSRYAPHLLQAALAGMGTCIEGIRIDENTPGYGAPVFMAIANATGKNSPRTNVARSSLDAASETSGFVRSVYRLLGDYVADEVSLLQSERGFSPSWAIGEARYLLMPILSGAALNDELLQDEIRRVPTLLVESGGVRRVSSVDQLCETESVWTVDSAGIRSAEAVIREIPAATVSLSKFSEMAPGRGFDLPPGPVLCGLGFGHVRELALEWRDIDLIRVDAQNRRTDLRWRLRRPDEKPAWVDLRPDDEGNKALLQQIAQIYGDRISPTSPILLLVRGGVDIEGAAKVSAIRSFGMMILLPKMPMAETLEKLWSEVQVGGVDRTLLTIAATLISLFYLRRDNDVIDGQREVSQFLTNISRFRDVPERRARELLLGKQFLEAIAQTNWVAFDSSAWSRQSPQGYSF